MTVQIVQFNVQSLPSIKDPRFAVSALGEDSYKLPMAPECWSGDELLLFYTLAEVFNVGCQHFGELRIENAGYKGFQFPSVQKNSEGVVGLLLGDQFISPLELGETQQLDKTGNPILDKKSGEVKTVPAWFLNGVRVFFGEGSYENPEVPKEFLYYPILEIRSNETVFQIQCQIKQKPHDVNKRKPDASYFDQQAFKAALDNHDEETVLATITTKKPGNFGISASISYLLSEIFVAKTFPVGGICIPVTGYTQMEQPDPKMGASMALQIDLANAWVSATGEALPSFEVPVKRKDSDVWDLFDIQEIAGLYVGSKHTAYENITALKNRDQSPSESEPWILRITAPNKNGNLRQVPDHVLMELSTVRRLPAVKTPQALLKSAAVTPVLASAHPEVF